MVLVRQLNSNDFNCIKAVKRKDRGSNVVLAHYLNSKDFICIQAVKLTEI